MAGDFLQAFQQDVLERTFGRYSTAQLSATTMWFHLYNTVLTDAATPATTGRVGTTAAADNYTPTNLANTTLLWTTPTAATTSVTQNKLEISFTTSASTGWGTVQSVMITSSSGTGGVGYAWGSFTTAQVVASGNTVKFSTGAITIGLS